MKTHTEWLTVSDVSRMLDGDLSASGVRKAADTRRLEVAAVMTSGVRLFDRAAVEKFRRERDRQSADGKPRRSRRTRS